MATAHMSGNDEAVARPTFLLKSCYLAKLNNSYFERQVCILLPPIELLALVSATGRLLPVNPHKTNHCQWPLCNNFRLLV